MAVLLLPSWGTDTGRGDEEVGRHNLYFVFALFCLAVPPSMWHLSFPARHRTHAPCIESEGLNHWTVRSSTTILFGPLSFILLISCSFPCPFPISPHHGFLFQFLLMLLYLFLGYQKAEQDKWDHYPVEELIYIPGARQVRQTDQSQQVVCQSIQLD